MQIYLRPNLLESVGVADINDCGATFTTTSTVEVNATGTSLRTVTRVGKVCNWPNYWRCPRPTPTSSPAAKYRSRCRNSLMVSAASSASHPIKLHNDAAGCPRSI
jgi:hypothetical protein